MSPLWRGLLAIVIGLFSAVPVVGWLVATGLAACAAAVAVVPIRRADLRWPTGADIAAVGTQVKLVWTFTRARWYLVAVALLVVLTGILAAVSSGEFGRLHRIAAMLLSNESAIVLFGVLGAVFATNPLVWMAVRGPLSRLHPDAAELVPSGRMIGYLERFVVFSLIAGGQPDAAAIAIAMKSIIRVPDARQHHARFVEYFLVGTLTSVGMSLAIAVMVRLLFGQPPL
jgi:hypothetical protein